jgi:ribonuclease D
MPLTPEIRWIDTTDALDTACAEMADAPVIALDTEFFRENTFHPVPALIQFAAGSGPAFIVDPLEVACTEAFRQLLGEGPLKLLHASSEDLEVFAHWADVALSPLVDTQIAQGLLGETPSMGYQKIVAHWTGKTLPKDETRSNWLLRPLTDSQLSYAALDVVYLVEVWDGQREALERLGRLAWLEEDCSELITQAVRSEAADGLWYLRHRQLWRLSPRQIEAYRRLCIWREGEARRRDVPRGWLVHDRLLYAIAEQLPKNRVELAKIEGLKPPLIKREGDDLLALVSEALQVDDKDLPPAMPSPMAPAFKQRLKALKSVVNAEAEALGMASEVLMRRRDLEALVTADLEGEPLPLPTGWRGARLNAALQSAVEGVSR